jgi:polysaccharide export outer membrane protein
MFRSGALLLPLLMLLLAGCASQTPIPTGLPPPGPANTDPRLSALWQERVSEAGEIDFPIGPGDVLEIAVAGLPELEERTVRVGGNGNVELPLIGVVGVSGLTEQQVTERLRQRLQASVMHDPAVSVFVREYRSRIVGVIGAVAKPGFHALSSRDDTLLDALTLGGGLSEQAALHILFMPATPSAGVMGPTLPVAAAAALADPRRGDPIAIELSSLTEGGTPVYLGLPVRPGDVILVPERGEVLVKGWVNSPGARPISPRLTVLGAIVAAGGPRFAADKDEIALIRSDRDGRKLAQVFDLEKLERGEQRDVPVQAGDVIDVSASPPKAVVSVFYDFARSIVNVGFGRTF